MHTWRHSKGRWKGITCLDCTTCLLFFKEPNAWVLVWTRREREREENKEGKEEVRFKGRKTGRDRRRKGQKEELFGGRKLFTVIYCHKHASPWASVLSENVAGSCSGGNPTPPPLFISTAHGKQYEAKAKMPPSHDSLEHWGSMHCGWWESLNLGKAPME